MVTAGAAQTVATTFSVLAVALVVMLVVTVWMAWRKASRAVRRLRGRALEVVAGIVPSRAGADGPAAAGARLQWAALGERHRMWRSVVAAERAVAAGQRAGVPVGDLPALVRRLRLVAGDVDIALRGSAVASPQSAGAARRRAAEITRTASGIRVAAADAMTTFDRGQSSGLFDAVEVEIEALRYGLRAVSGRP